MIEFTEDFSQALWLRIDDAVNDTKRTQNAEPFTSVLLGPAGFATYARILDYPDPTEPDQAEPSLTEEELEKYPDVHHVLTQVMHVLAAHTSTPDDYFFAFWNGWPYQVEMPKLRTFEFFEIRDCWLAHGSFDDWIEWTGLDEYPPAAIWPRDRSWFLAYDVDAHFTGIGASDAALADVFAVGSLPILSVDRNLTDVFLYGQA